MCTSQTSTRDWAIYCCSKNTSALIRWNKIMPPRWKQVLKIFSNVVFNLLLPWMNTHVDMNSTAPCMQMNPLPSLPTCEIPHRLMFWILTYVWGHLRGEHLQLGAASLQISCQSLFLYWMALSWLVGQFLVGRPAGLCCMESTKSWKLSLQAWNLASSWTATSGMMGTHQVLRCTWYDGSCFLGSCWSSAFPQSRELMHEHAQDMDIQQVGTWENRALACTNTSSTMYVR